MADPAVTYPYETRLNVLYPPLEVIDEKSLSDGCEYKWFNQTLCQVNGSVVRMGVLEGEYHWHQHTADDEFFYVLEGELSLEVDGDEVLVRAGEGVEIGPGIAHQAINRSGSSVRFLVTSQPPSHGDRVNC